MSLQTGETISISPENQKMMIVGGTIQVDLVKISGKQLWSRIIGKSRSLAIFCVHLGKRAWP